MTNARRVVSGTFLAMTAIAAVTAAVLVVLWRIAFVPVLSPSMTPSFAAGDAVVTRQVRTSSLTPGQVAVLPLPEAHGQRYVHRITSVDRTGGGTAVTTKGDANAAADPWTLHITSASVPVVIGHVPSAGRLATGLDAKVRLVLLAGVVACALVGMKRAFVG